MKSNVTRCLAVSCLAALASGCIGGSPHVTYLKDKTEVPHFVAILPPDNKTSDTAAPDTVRRASAEMLIGLGIIPVTSPAQDAQVMDLQAGGTALNDLDPKKIAAALGVDGLLYTTITVFRDVNLIVAVQRKVAATFKLIDRLGNKIWEATGTGYNQAVDPNPQSWALNAGKLTASSVGLDINKMLEKALKVHLLQETQMMTGFMRPHLPQWPRSNKPGIDLAADLAAKQAAKAAAASAKAARL